MDQGAVMYEFKAVHTAHGVCALWWPENTIETQFIELAESVGTWKRARFRSLAKVVFFEEPNIKSHADAEQELRKAWELAVEWSNRKESVG